jgi:hypothetical protein
VTRPAADRRAAWVFSVSGALGFLVGVAHWDWQWAVEHAQVMAGLVTYPAESAPGIAQAKAWSIVPQAGAVLLRLGVSEPVLSRILSGFLGCLSFQALATVTYALGRSALVALGAAVVIFVSRATDYGVVYPIALLGSGHTYGIAGLSFVVLTAGVLGLGWFRTGAFLLGLGPAVHPGLGLWALAIVAAAMIPFRRDLTPSRLGAAFATGVTVTIISFGIHKAMATPVPAIDPETAHRFFRAFVTFWDGHRFPVPLRDKGVTLAIEAAVLTLAALAWSGRERPAPDRLLLRIAAIGGFASLGLALWSRAPAGWMPDWLVALMPGRMLNVAIMVLPSLLFGLLSASRGPLLARVCLLLLAGGLLTSRGSLLWTAAGVPPPISFGANSVLAFGTLGALLVGAMAWRWPDRPPTDHRPLHAALMCVFVLAAAVTIVDASRNVRWRMDARSPWRSDAALAAATHGSGPLLTGGDLFMIQLRTRRPVVLDGGALDVLPYAVESGPEMDRVLRGVYGIDLFNPPAEARGGGRVPAGANRQVWTALSRDRWRQLAREYGFRQVLTPAGWTLDLPIVASSPAFVLYAIAD